VMCEQCARELVERAGPTAQEWRQPRVFGPCAVCNAPSVEADVCSLCEKIYPYCLAHETESRVAITGHVLRVHPSSIPQVVDQLVKNESAFAELQAEAKREPGMWKVLFDYIATRRNREN
jgi:hypothetical protein